MLAAHRLDVLVICETRPAGETILRAIETALAPERRCVPVWARAEYEAAVEDLSRYEAVILGNQLGWSDGLTILEDLASRDTGTPVVMATDSNGVDLVAAGFRLGMRDFLRSSQFERLPAILENARTRQSGASDEGVGLEVQSEPNEAITSILTDYVFSYYIRPDGAIENEWRSDGLRRISGYSKDEFETVDWWQILHPDDHAVVMNRTSLVIQGEAPITEYRIRTSSGMTRWIREFTRPIWDPEEARYSRFVGSAHDITEERMADASRVGQMHILELIATGAPIERIIEEIARLIEKSGLEPNCVIHRYEESSGTLDVLHARNVRPEYLTTVDPLVDEMNRSCQAAAVLHHQVVVAPDVSDEDRWTDQMRVAAECGYASIVVVPIHGSRRNVLGTMTLCRTQPGEPGGAEFERTTILCRLLGIAIEKVESERALQRAELQYRRLAEEIPAITFIASADDLRLTYLSPQASAMIDEDRAARYREQTLFDLVHPDDRRAVAAAFRPESEERNSALIEFRVDSQDGVERWLQCSAVVLNDDADDEPYWQGILLDVTARRRAERALRESQTQFRALFDNNPHIVFTLNTRGRFQRINPATRNLTGYQEEDLVGRPFTSVLVAGELERVWYHFRNTMRGESQQFETEVFTRRGGRLQLSVTFVPYVVDGVVAGVSAIAEDISERVQLQEQLTHQAFHDDLTGLPNRAMFNERLIQAFNAMQRSRDHVAVCLVDLDNFKVINDSLGHESGDEYLKVIASWLEGVVGPMDSVARFGGDEFSVLLNYPAEDYGYPLRLAEQIGQDLSKPVLINGREITSGVSIGIAIHADGVLDRRDLLRQADIALNQAKRGGAGKLYRVFEEAMHEHIVQRLEVERDLRRAIRRNEFEVHYQPIIDLITERVVKVEALVRWNHPERGLLAPGYFLPVAEETGQITEVDELVMRTACQEITRWNRNHPSREPLVLAINLSVRDFRHSDLTERIQRTLMETGCDAAWLKFEITESTMMHDISTALAALKQLRNIGIGFSIDDFGTGYSSLAYLQRLPLDTLKIDRSFIDGLGGDEGDELMVRTIISLASALNLEVIAEGIETTLQLERARELGCHRAQGYLIARPAPFEELIPLFDGQYRDDIRHRNSG